jgi:1-acyl-sn-glycerol-3-phosphate acyltransferase
MNLLWLPINLLQAVFAALWSFTCIILALVSSKLAGNPRPGLWVARDLWSPVVLAAGLVRVEVHGLERIDRSRPYFVVANHQSWVDIPILFVALKMYLLFVAKQELASIPGLRHYVEGMGMVFVNRADRSESMRSVDRVTERLREGWSVLSFPEGTRSIDGRVQRFRSGTFAAALDAGVQILPIAIEEAARIVPRKGLRFRPGRVRVAVCAPISTEGFTREDRNALAGRAQEAVEAELERLREVPGGGEKVRVPA